MTNRLNKKNNLSRLIETELEKAELVIASKAITDKLQDIAEDLAKMEADDIMPMGDSFRTAFGPQIAQQFSSVSTAKIRELVTAISDAKDAIGNEILRMEKAINGDATNDMAIEPMNSEPKVDIKNPSEDKMSDEMSDDSVNDEDDDDMDIGDEFGYAGRAKKESHKIRGKKLAEAHPFKPTTSDPIIDMTTFDTRASDLAMSIQNMIDDAKFDGKERRELSDILNHLASCCFDYVHWTDPDAKVEAALNASKIDMRIPEVKNIVAKLKKLAHMISLKHEGIMENKKPIFVNLKKIKESNNMDVFLLNEFRKVLASTKNTKKSVKYVAEKYKVDASDIVSIVRDAKKHSILEAKKRLPFFVKTAKTAAQLKMESDARWNALVENDVKKLAEAHPFRPRTPADMRRHEEEKEESDWQEKNLAYRMGATDKSEVPSSKKSSFFGGIRKKTTEEDQNPTSTDDDEETPAQQPNKASTPAVGTSSGSSSAPVGQSPQKVAKTANPPVMPGMTGKQILNNGDDEVTISPMKKDSKVPDFNTHPLKTSGNVTMMSKSKPFPKPGAPLIGSGMNQSVSEQRKTKKR